MEWFLGLLGVSCVGVAVFVARIFLKIGDAERSKIRAQMAEDAYAKKSKEADIYNRPAGKWDDTVDGL